jgi:uncharacterized membrane protein
MNTNARHRRGQIAVILTLAVPALIGAIAFGTDIVVLYTNWAQLQKSTDTAVMAGAAYLPSDPTVAISTARSYARICGIRNDEIVATRVGPDRFTISMTVTRKVTLVTRFLGLGQGNIAANSTAVVHSIPLEEGLKGHRMSASRGGPLAGLAYPQDCTDLYLRNFA